MSIDEGDSILSAAHKIREQKLYFRETKKNAFFALANLKLNEILRLYYYVIQFETQIWINNEHGFYAVYDLCGRACASLLFPDLAPFLISVCWRPKVRRTEL